MTNRENQIQTLSALDHLIAQNNLEGQLHAFLLCCKVDSLAPATLRYYKQTLRAFVSFAYSLGVKEAHAITTYHIRLFLLELQKTNCPMSIHDYYRAIRRFFNWMIGEGMLEHSPMASIRPPRVPKKLVRPFTSDQINDLLELCDETKFLGARNRAIILVLLDTGLRLRELTEIQISDIDIDRETISVMGKGARERLVRMGKVTQKALLKYLLMRHDNYPCLWVSEERRPMTADGIQHMISKLGKLAGLKDVRCSPHTFRHTFATNSLLNGAGEFEVQSLLGHATLTMTRRYVSSLRSENAIIGHRRFSPVDNMLK